MKNIGVRRELFHENRFKSDEIARKWIEKGVVLYLYSKAEIVLGSLTALHAHFPPRFQGESREKLLHTGQQFGHSTKSLPHLGQLTSETGRHDPKLRVNSGLFPLYG